MAAAAWVEGCLAPGSLDHADEYRVHATAAGGASKGSGGHENAAESGSGGSTGVSAGDAAPSAGGDVTSHMDSGAPSAGGADGTGGASNGGSSGGSAAGNVIYVEGESGAITDPMTVGTDANASGGKYVWVADGAKRDDSTMLGTMGIATLPVTVKDAGNYAAFGRVIGPTVNNDSFWVKMDDGDWVQWNDVSTATMNVTDWTWVTVHDTAQADMPVHYMLDPGMHTFYVAYRESGAKLDVLAFTTDPSFMPTGVAP